jgi:hypothetical protein
VRDNGAAPALKLLPLAAGSDHALDLKRAYLRR